MYLHNHHSQVAIITTVAFIVESHENFSISSTLGTNPRFVFSDDFVRHPVDEFSAGEQKISTSVACRTIRIGTHKFETKEKVRNVFYSIALNV